MREESKTGHSHCEINLRLNVLLPYLKICFSIIPVIFKCSVNK